MNSSMLVFMSLVQFGVTTSWIFDAKLTSVGSTKSPLMQCIHAVETVGCTGISCLMHHSTHEYSSKLAVASTRPLQGRARSDRRAVSPERSFLDAPRITDREGCFDRVGMYGAQAGSRTGRLAFLAVLGVELLSGRRLHNPRPGGRRRRHRPFRGDHWTTRRAVSMAETVGRRGSTLVSA